MSPADAVVTRLVSALRMPARVACSSSSVVTEKPSERSAVPQLRASRTQPASGLEV